MDLESIVLFLAMKHDSATAIDIWNEMTAVLGREAIGYSTVTKYTCQDSSLPRKAQSLPELRAAKSLTRQFSPPATVHRHLTKSLGSLHANITKGSGCDFQPSC